MTQLCFLSGHCACNLSFKKWNEVLLIWSLWLQNSCTTYQINHASLVTANCSGLALSPSISSSHVTHACMSTKRLLKQTPLVSFAKCFCNYFLIRLCRYMQLTVWKSASTKHLDSRVDLPHAVGLRAHMQRSVSYKQKHTETERTNLHQLGTESSKGDPRLNIG